MFKINYVLSEKFAPNGQPIRFKSTGQELLKTEAGVKRFLDTMKPFVSVTIVDTVSGKDITSEFPYERPKN